MHMVWSQQGNSVYPSLWMYINNSNAVLFSCALYSTTGGCQRTVSCLLELSIFNFKLWRNKLKDQCNFIIYVHYINTEGNHCLCLIFLFFLFFFHSSTVQISASTISFEMHRLKHAFSPAGQLQQVKSFKVFLPAWCPLPLMDLKVQCENFKSMAERGNNIQNYVLVSI